MACQADEEEDEEGRLESTTARGREKKRGEREVLGFHTGSTSIDIEFGAGGGVATEIRGRRMASHHLDL
jgi:hypothetical protein